MTVLQQAKCGINCCIKPLTVCMTVQWHSKQKVNTTNKSKIWLLQTLLIQLLPCWKWKCQHTCLYAAEK